MDVHSYGTIPHQGGSIGIIRGSGAGTLGGHLFLNVPGQSPISCFLTCYHVIRSNNDTVRKEQDKNGLRLGQQTHLSAYTAVEYPANLDSKATRAEMEKDPRKDLELNHVKNLINNSVKGHVIAASGLRVNANNRRLDWALVRNSADHFSRIRPVPRKSLPLFERPDGCFLNEDSSIRTFERIKKGDWVAKKGRTTNWTVGEVNRMRRVWDWPETGRITQEVEVFPGGEDFARPGDSGSVVHNKAGELVGMLFGKDSPSNNHNMGIASLITDIQEDIRIMTGGGFISLE